MYNEYDLSIFRSSIAFEKAYNEFELMNGFYLVESDGVKPKASGVLKKVVDALLKLIDSLIEKVKSIVDKLKQKFSKNTDKIKVKEDPKNIIKDYEDKKSKCYKMIDDVNKCKTEEDLEKIKPNVEKTLEDVNKKRISKAKVAGGIIITAAALLTAFALVQNAQKSDQKKVSKTNNTDSNNDPVETKKEGIIARILNSIKSINTNEAKDICNVYEDYKENNKNDIDIKRSSNVKAKLARDLINGKIDKKRALEIIDGIKKEFGEDAFPPVPFNNPKPKSEWSVKYMEELDLMSISGQCDEKFFRHLADVSDYIKKHPITSKIKK